ncbi:hypothetical protein IB262_34385 [Ensifer sp. ENS02]|uniref:hypothetical protein n=1 Tax=Ensifer TaxID=106591 RepID=UPI000DE5631B|nr:hypothetical protein [Ensifer sp. ENS02]MBD9524947.1 hypothetical protein [Ensifer sp. ENS02]
MNSKIVNGTDKGEPIFAGTFSTLAISRAPVGLPDVTPEASKADDAPAGDRWRLVRQRWSLGGSRRQQSVRRRHRGELLLEMPSAVATGMTAAIA